MNTLLTRLAATLVLAIAPLPMCRLAAQPAHTAVLVVSGKSLAGPAGTVALDMRDLQALPQHSFSTATPWTKTVQKYTGPLLRDVLARARARGADIRATALNDYQVTIPAADAQAYDMIVALQIDGKPIAVRDRGPLFVIYPFDSKPELQNSRYYERSIWQLKSMQVD